MAASTETGMRPRVRTPGKHIVMFGATALIVFIASVSLMRAVEGWSAESENEGRFVGAASEAVPLQEFLVDLAPDNSGRTAYLKMTAAIVPPARGAGRTLHKIDQTRPELAERLTFLLRGLSPEDFDGEDGMRRVKMEMLRRVNLVIAPEKARDVIISDLIIQ